MYRIFIFLSAIFLLDSCNTQKGYNLSGRIEGLDDVTIYLQQRVDKKYVSLDSVGTTDGTFEFTGSVEIPDVYYLYIPGKRGRAMIFLENSPISLRAYADTIWRADISGSDVQDEYIALDGQVNAIYDRVNRLWEEYKQAEASGDTAIANELEAQMNEIYDEAEVTQKKC